MNFFEQELRKLVGQSNALADPKYIGRACYGRVSDNIRAKLQFVEMGHADHYVGLKVTLLNNTEGEIDTNIIRFKDIWNDDNPHIWRSGNDHGWYGYKPTPADFEMLADSFDEHLEIFSEDIEYGQTMT